MRKISLALLLVLTVGFCMSKVPAYRSQCAETANVANPQNYSKYVASPLVFLASKPKTSPLQDQSIRRALVKDFRKWTKWVMDAAYVPSDDVFFRDLELYKASAETGGADIAYLSYTIRGSRITISQTAERFCLHVYELSMPKDEGTEEMERFYREQLSDLVRPDVLKETPISRLSKGGTVWRIEAEKGTRGFLNTEGKELLFSLVKESLRQSLVSPLVVPLNQWFEITQKKVRAGSTDMEDIPRLATEDEIREYLHKQKQ